MGDSGEGLVDAEARIQERMEELQSAREQARRAPIANVEQVRKVESLRLARKELSRQMETAGHAARKIQLEAAITDIDRQISMIESTLS
jgi:hypothetical protein